MVHDELGTPPGQQIHWYFTKTVWGKHVCTVNVCDWLTAPCDQDEAELTQEWWRFGGWSGAVAMLLWTEWVFGARSTCVSALWQCEVGAGRRTCLSGTQTGGAGSLSPTVCGPGLKPVLGQCLLPFRSLSRRPRHPRSLYDRSFFGVFWCSY